MKIPNQDNMWLISRCLVESLTILGKRDIIDAEKAVEFINKEDLQGLQLYLEGIRTGDT